MKYEDVKLGMKVKVEDYPNCPDYFPKELVGKIGKVLEIDDDGGVLLSFRHWKNGYDGGTVTLSSKKKIHCRCWIDFGYLSEAKDVKIRDNPGLMPKRSK